MQLKKVIVLSLIFSFIILFSCTVVFQSNEEVVDYVKSADSGVIFRDRNQPLYLNDSKSIIHSAIKLTSGISRKQSVNRYMKVSGFADTVANKSGYFRSVTAEIYYFGKKEITFSFPVNRFGYFSGYLYFTKRGDAKIYLYIPYDYLRGKTRSSRRFTTEASVVFYCNVGEPVPADLICLIPSKNVNCGNKKIKKIARHIARECKTDTDKARKTYEYIVLLGRMKMLKFKKYNTADQYHNMFLASDMLDNRSGICNDFSELYAALLRAEGVKIKKIWGYSDPVKSQGHQWNLVQLGDSGIWSEVDPSWGVYDNLHYRKYAAFYPDFDQFYFDNAFGPTNHASFIYDRHVEF